jgi:SAM-dependent methyltransferase
MRCRICGTANDRPALDLAAPALASTYEQIAVPTRVYVCASCGHIQSSDLPDIAEFYDTRYKCSMASEEFDQLCGMRDGRPIFRTDAQAAAVLGKVFPRLGAQVLDYGAGKAATLRKITAQRPDLVPHVFDVSDDYHASWRGWLPEDAMATYTVPEGWNGRFDLITAHYVFEHVQAPADIIRGLATLLAPRGQLFFSVPDCAANVGDLLVAEHVSHFTEVSLRRLVDDAGLALVDIDAGALPGAFTVVCSVSGKSESPVGHAQIEAAVEDARARCARLNKACRRLEQKMAANAARRSAIFGAGFYGAFLLTRAAAKPQIELCIDNNHHLWGTTLFDVPVRSPADLPMGTEIVYVGLNPGVARAAAASVPALQRPSLDLVFLEE